MTDLATKIKIMQAALDGEEIEYMLGENDEWNLAREPVFDWNHFNYRIKPKPLEFWTALFDDGSCGSLFNSKEEPHRKYRGFAEYVRMIKVREVTDE